MSTPVSAVDDLVRRVGDALAPVADVRLAYVFGSRVTGGARSDSDLDVAVAYPPGVDGAARERARRAVFVALTDSLGALGERADIVDLERADSAVAFQAVRNGRLARSRSESDRVRVVSRVCRRYDDDAPRRELFRRAARTAVERLGSR